MYSMKDKAGHYTIAQLSIKPAMLVSSVHPVVACYATAPRVCTLVLFIFQKGVGLNPPVYESVCIHVYSTCT